MAGKCICCVLALVAVQSLVSADVSRTRREDHVLRVTTIAEPPYVIVKDPEGTGNNNYDGFMIELLQKISEKAGFAYHIELVPDGKYGVEQGSSGQWSGMIGQVMDGEADMAAASMTISPARKEVIDFTEPYMTLHTTVLIKKSPATDAAITSVEDLVGQSEVKYGLMKDGITEDFFKYTIDAVYRQIWRAIQKDTSVFELTVARGVQRVKDSDSEYAFIMESSTAEYWVNRSPCNLRTFGQISALHYGLVVAKGSPLKIRLNTAISALVENGEIDKLQAKWWRGDEECNGGSGADPSVAVKFGAVVLGLAFSLSYYY